jgi:hypothetical protein
MLMLKFGKIKDAALMVLMSHQTEDMLAQVAAM